MKLQWRAFMIALASAVVLFVGTLPQTAQAALADGTYKIPFTVMHGSDPSVSIANDYWEKPATLTVENGAITAEMTINHSSWIVEMQTPQNGGFAHVQVVSEDEAADKRVIRFPIESIETMTEANIHVIVPDIDYDHSYTIRFDFEDTNVTTVETKESNEEANENGDEPLAAAQSPNDDTKQSSAEENKTMKENNPQTSDATPIVLLFCLAIISAIVLLRKRITQA